MLNTRIVLVNPSHPGNIGATARAMKNMGLSELYLVEPKIFPHHDATVRASGADEILQQAVVVNTLQEALVGCDKVYATSARSRRLEWPLCTPHEAAVEINSYDQLKSCVIFGRESSGLTNEELSLAHKHICIPTSEHFSSLNLAQSVQVIVYEIFAVNYRGQATRQEMSDTLASADEQDGFLEHLRDVMIHANFLNPNQPRKLMQRIRRLFQRAEMSKTEVNILRGFLSAIDKKIK